VDTAELALAAAASESLTVALADSLAPTQGFVVSQAGASVSSLSACDDHIDSHGWESTGSRIIEMELPPGFTGPGTLTGQVARWNGPAGWIHASGRVTDAHAGWTGLITSECDVFISGAPTHIDLVTTSYGRSIHAFIKPQDAPAIGIEAQTKTIDGQAQLLHSIRTARISAAWGRAE
jgi:hypothetical protein